MLSVYTVCVLVTVVFFPSAIVYVEIPLDVEARVFRDLQWTWARAWPMTWEEWIFIISTLWKTYGEMWSPVSSVMLPAFLPIHQSDCSPPLRAAPCSGADSVISLQSKETERIQAEFTATDPTGCRELGPCDMTACSFSIERVLSVAHSWYQYKP